MPKRRHAHRSASFRPRLLVAIGVLVVIAGGVAYVVSDASSTLPASVSSRDISHNGVCPLTDEPAPGGKVPQRPAVAVKIGNEPDGARPQSGLDEADIVYDTPAEGFIMRYVAVYQCQSASTIGPVRSVRWVDWHILQAFGTPVLAFAGGIDPDVDTVDSLGWLKPADLIDGQSSAAWRSTSRLAPDNLYTSTAKLWALYPSDRTPPRPVFSYGGSLPSSARTTTSLGIDFSAGTDAVWKWSASGDAWLHTYEGATDVDALTNKPVTTTNIVVQIVRYSFGPYPESPGSTGDVESQTVGSGKGYVLRDGKSIAVTWHRKSLDAPTTFTDAQRKPVTLAPGRTWVEIVPDTIASTPGALTITH